VIIGSIVSPATEVTPLRLDDNVAIPLIANTTVTLAE
jgi:dolichol kinase